MLSCSRKKLSEPRFKIKDKSMILHNESERAIMIAKHVIMNTKTPPHSMLITVSSSTLEDSS